MSGGGAANDGRAANRLAGESSPYLRQHAHNPVDWWPWGPGAIAEARRRGAPIFLSVGYSTCYWCHVMERESFEDPATARVLNEHFVSVKLDREERPDLDDVYMAAVQMMTGHGGWPMSVFLEPGGLRPFYAGTYFPPEPRHGMPSFRQVLGALGDAWRERRAEVEAQAEQVARAVAEKLGAAGVPTPIGPEQVASAVSTLLTIFDRTNGGFGGAPKFPQPAYLEFLLEARTAIDAASAGAMDAAARQTLDRMALGGVFDQAGGGFHRYSVDASWLVPHFEKMLYDNGQLLETYARSARVYRSALYERVARRTAAYVLREMTAPDGAFFTAQDAEVDGREGLNYLWTMEDFRSVLGADAPRAARLYGVDLGPNFRDPHHPDAPAVNVLRLEAEPDEPTAAWLDGVNQRLLAARGRRAQPRRDDKVLAAWNGLMIGGLAVAGRELGDTMLVEAAARGARGALGRLWRADEGRLLRCERAGGEPVAGTLEDYAMMAHGLLALAAARRDERAWVDRAAALLGAAERRLGDGAGGFFDAEEGAESLFVRPRSTYDGAMPCGASVMINAMIDLHAFDGAGGWLRRAAKCLATMSAAVADSPVGSINATRGLLRLMRADRSALREAVPEGAPARSGTGGAPAGDVSVWASTAEVYVLPDRPAAFVLRLEVPEGLHINDATADADSGGAVTALRVDVAGGTGFAAYADYPTGRPLDGAGHRVLDGVVEFEVAVEAQGDVTGSPFIAVSYQACSDRACRQPVVQRLDVLLKRGQGPYAAGLA